MKPCLAPGLLQAWTDGELAPAAREPAQAHLAACGACRTALTAAAGRAQWIGELCAALGEAPVAAPRPAPLFRRPFWAPALGTPAALLLALLAVWHAPAPRRVVAAAPAPQLFTPLPGAAPFQMAAVERVALPLRAVDPDPSVPPNLWVQADVLVGEDGAPRAWRLVPTPDPSHPTEMKP